MSLHRVCMRLLTCVVTLLVGSTLGAQTPGGPRTPPPGAMACPEPAARTGTRDTSRSFPRDSMPRDSAQRSQTRRSPASANPSVVLYVSASAREVRFASQPRILVRLCGAVTDSVRVVERRNLPDPVQPGRTYRDVFIAVEILGHLNADCLSRRIGVAPGGTTSGEDCASLMVRDSARAAPFPPRRP
jgi:hypothetical protein